MDIVISSYFETKQFTLQPCQEHCNKLIRGRRLDPFVMQKHAPSQRKGEETANTIAIFCMYLSCFYSSRVYSTMLTTPRHNYSTSVGQVKFGKQDKIETHKDSSSYLYPSRTLDLVGWCVLLVLLWDINSAQGSRYKCMWLHNAGPICRLLL